MNNAPLIITKVYDFLLYLIPQISDSYATRKGKGTHAALNRFQEFARKTQYALKCDIRQYFPNIDHDVLLGLIERKIACEDIWTIS